LNIQPLKISVCSMLFLFFLASQTSTAFGFGVGRKIMRGRDALLGSNPKAALPNFAAIAQSHPNYINCAQGLCIGIWTYLGRTYHELGNNQKALESLKKGKVRYHQPDRFNKIYLGLVMAQTGQKKEGTAELDAGLKALGAWLSNFAGRGTTGQHWDPSGNLQKGIADTRALLNRTNVSYPQMMIWGGLINWDKVNTEVHWLGVRKQASTAWLKKS